MQPNHLNINSHQSTVHNPTSFLSFLDQLSESPLKDNIRELHEMDLNINTANNIYNIFSKEKRPSQDSIIEHENKENRSQDLFIKDNH